MKIILKIRLHGKRGYDISSVPLKKLEKANSQRKDVLPVRSCARKRTVERVGYFLR